MKLQKALDMVRIEYERAQGLALVRNPLAWALYRVWKIADGQTPDDTDPCHGCGYKANFEWQRSHNDCTSCGAARTCQYAPRAGVTIIRINCPLWQPKG